MITPALAAALDRTQTSSRDATYILAAAASSLGFDINDINLSASSIHRKRIRLRKKVAREVKENCKLPNYLVVHWDGKHLPESTGGVMVERLPIVVSGLETEQLLGVPKLCTGSGANQSKAIIKVLDEWNLSQHIKAMCFDTTSTNTGN